MDTFKQMSEGLDRLEAQIAQLRELVQCIHEVLHSVDAKGEK